MFDAAAARDIAPCTGRAHAGTAAIRAAADGHVFPLLRIADLVLVSGQPQIARKNLEPMVAVTGRIQGRRIGRDVLPAFSSMLSESFPAL